MGKAIFLGQRLPDASRWYYLKDGLGSIVAVINGNGSTVANRYAYDPYGKVTTSTGTQANPWGYAGGYLDSTGLVKFGTRYYDPNLGRWTQHDPLAGTVVNPATMNRYTYVGCNPVNGTDASGADWWNPSTWGWYYGPGQSWSKCGDVWGHIGLLLGEGTVYLWLGRVGGFGGFFGYAGAVSAWSFAVYYSWYAGQVCPSLLSSP
jgi:RHS repeat-associated protein